MNGKQKPHNYTAVRQIPVYRTPIARYPSPPKRCLYRAGVYMFLPIKVADKLKFEVKKRGYSMTAISLLREKFEQHEVFISDFRSQAIVSASNEVISKGFLYNLSPFENEIYGFKKGKQLKSIPSNTKNVYVYFRDEQDNILAIDEYTGVPNIIGHTLCFLCESGLLAYRFVSDRLNNVKLIQSVNGQVNTVYNYGRYGQSIEEYMYNGGVLQKRTSKSKEHSKDEYSLSEHRFFYNEAGTIMQIVKAFPNGYSKVVYQD
jgi:hypothetical protein